MDRPVFSLEGVNALLPLLSRVVGRQLERRGKIEQLLAKLGRELGDIPETIALEPSDSEPVRELKKSLVEHIEEYRAGWRQVEELGAVLKDPRIGLLDFYGTVDGKLVWLCWKYGEPECAYYHGLEEGFSARKPIRVSAKQRLLN